MANSCSGSDTICDFPCDVCEEGNSNKEALVFCVICKQYLCEDCNTFHSRVAVTKEHRVINREEFKDDVIASAIAEVKDTIRADFDKPTEMCPKHAKVVDMYCIDHNAVGCNTCVSLEHRTCKELRFVPDIARTLLTDKSVQRVRQNLSERMNTVKDLKEAFLDQATQMEVEKDRNLREVNARRKAIKDLVDSRMDQICNDMTKTYSESRDSIEEVLKPLGTEIERLDNLNTSLKIHDGESVSQRFVNLKHTETILKEDIISQLRTLYGNKKCMLSVEYHVRNDIELLHELFGKVCVRYLTMPQAVRPTASINVKVKSDMSVCAIADICILPGGSIVVTDWNNGNIKSLNSDHNHVQTVTDTLSMPNPPWGICAINDLEVAVTIPGSLQVLFVEVGSGGKNKMAPTHAFEVTYGCHGIAYANGRLYIGHASDFKLTTYDLKGKCLETLSTDQSGVALFGKLCHLCVLPVKQHVAVAAASKGIVVINKSGKRVAQHKYPNKKLAYAVCSDDSDNVFVADFKTKDVVVISSRQRLTACIHRLAKTPRSMRFQKQTKKLFVSTEDSDYILVFSVDY